MWYTSDNVKNYFIGDELFFLLSACIGHDLKHPGKNNGYMTARRNMNALVSFDTSVLESMHAATLLKIIYKYNNCNILKGYNDEDRKKYQSLMVKGIIATDMAFHHKMIEDFKNCKFDKDNITDKDKEFLMGFLLHASDLNNSA